jgi:hypothetical protein
MDAQTFEHVADLVEARPFLSDAPAAFFRSVAHDHEKPETGCTGGPHCYATKKATHVLTLVGER